MAVLAVPAMYLKNHLSSVHDPTIADLNIREHRIAPNCTAGLSTP